MTRRPVSFARATTAAAIVLAAALPAIAPAAPTRTGSVVRVEHRDPASLPTRGPADAPVTIELFFMPASRLALTVPMFRALERLQAAHPTRVRVIYRVVKRDSNMRIAIAALEAHAQGLFFELMEQLHLQRTASSLTREQLLELARRVGMDTERLDAAITEKRYADALVESDHRLKRYANDMNPSVLVNSRLARITMNPVNDRELDAEVRGAYERAMELVDQGVPVRKLSAAFDELERRAEAPFVLRPPIRDDLEPTEPPLATPALALGGLPTFGPVAEPAGGTLPIVLLCRPTDAGCSDLMRNLRALQMNYASDVRIVWAPWFDVEQEDAAEQSLLADAALCAERVGSSAKELAASSGWAWVIRLYEVARRLPGKSGDADAIIDTVGRDLGIDSPVMSACRAGHAGTALAWVARARQAGITRSPAVVIGGRIYDGITNGSMIQQLVEVELQPGLLGKAAPDYR